MAASPSTPRPASSWIITLTVRMYRWLLGACPPGFRRDYGREMAQVFRQCCQDAYRQRGRRGVLHLWLPTLIDLLIGVIAEYSRALALAFTRRTTVDRLRSTAPCLPRADAQAGCARRSLQAQTSRSDRFARSAAGSGQIDKKGERRICRSPRVLLCCA